MEDTPQGLQLSNRVNGARQADACRFDLQGHFRFEHSRNAAVAIRLAPLARKPVYDTIMASQVGLS